MEIMARSSDVSHCIILSISLRDAATAEASPGGLGSASQPDASRPPGNDNKPKRAIDSAIRADDEAKTTNGGQIDSWNQYNQQVAARLIGNATSEAIAAVFNGPVRVEITRHADKESDGILLHRKRVTHQAATAVMGELLTGRSPPIWTSEFWAGNPSVGAN
jgi:hypothetical protein